MKFLIEQLIWDYLDGNCSPEEQKEIKRLIESDVRYRAAYQEQLEIQAALSKMDLEEPPMSFKRNVMEAVKAGPQPGSIKPLIDKRIIYAISSFFLVSIIAGLSIFFYQIDWPLQDTARADGQFLELKLTQVSRDWLISGFLFLDTVAVLYSIDFILRKKLRKEQSIN